METAELTALHLPVSQTARGDTSELRKHLMHFDRAVHLYRKEQHITASDTPIDSIEYEPLCALPPLFSNLIGSGKFMQFYGVKYPYMSGAMANGIASESLVIALAKAGILASFGSAGLHPDRIASAIDNIQKAVGDRAFSINLIHLPSNPELELKLAQLYVNKQVTIIEASAFMKLTEALVYYRAKNLREDSNGQIIIQNRLIAKLSRLEIAKLFLVPPPQELVDTLLQKGLISPIEASLIVQIPMADDITFEADSGGHTDGRSVACFLPPIIDLRNRLQATRAIKTRIGAGGGVGSPASALGYFMSGADYVVVGSVNQSCRESGTSKAAKLLLSEVESTDCILSPAADMFEIGANVQVIKRGTLYPLRARKLADLYKKYNAIENLSEAERNNLEKNLFKMSLEEVWQRVHAFFSERDPAQLTVAEKNPKKKMALIFRWYLGSSTRWALQGQDDRKHDFQIMCGPAMGAFNSWAADSYLANPEHRSVVDVAEHFMRGSAYLYRVKQIQMAGVELPEGLQAYTPEPL